MPRTRTLRVAGGTQVMKLLEAILARNPLYCAGNVSTCLDHFSTAREPQGGFIHAAIHTILTCGGSQLPLIHTRAFPFAPPCLPSEAYLEGTTISVFSQKRAMAWFTAGDFFAHLS